jgi:hypothetical protein
MGGVCKRCDSKGVARHAGKVHAASEAMIITTAPSQT